MKAIIVTMLLLLLAGTQACQQEQPERKITEDTVSGHTTGGDVKKSGSIKLDTTNLDSQFLALRTAIQKGLIKGPRAPRPMMMKRDTTIDTILDHDIIIALVTAYPLILVPPLTPYIHIFEPEEGATVASEVTVKFTIVDAPFRYDIDEMIFWIDGHWRTIDTGPGEYKVTGLASGTHTLMIELAPGPDYPDPVPAPDAVTFTIP